MFSNFYNGSIRKMVVAFGSLFNQIKIDKAESGGIKQILVPISYSSKEKYLSRISADLASPVQVTLPRMGFEITGFVYDGTRKRNTLSRTLSRVVANGVDYSYAEVPYNIDFALYISVRNMEDGLRIVEQILPYFAPEFVVTINFGGLNQKIDVPIYLSGMSSEDQHEGEFDSRRIITFTLNFTMKTYVFGNTKHYSEIRKVLVNVNNLDIFDDWVAGNTAGNTADYVHILTGITGPSGASSGITNYTSMTTYTEYTHGTTGGV